MLFEVLSLLKLDGSAGFLKLLLDSLSLILGDAFLDLGGNAFNSGLSLNESETGDGTDNLDNAELGGAEAGHNDIKLSLLLDSGSGGAGGSGSSHSSGGNAELFLESVNELGELKYG